MTGKYEKRKKRAKWPWILVLVLALLGALLFWQRENLQAVWMYLTHDAETVAQNVEAQRQEHQAVIEAEAEVTITVKPPDRAQSDALLEGLATADEVKESLGIGGVRPQEKPKPAPEEGQDREPAAEGPEAPEAPAEEAPETPTEPEEPPKTKEQLVNDCVAELYAYKTDLMAQLGGMKKEVLDIWIALEPHQRTQTKKMSLAMEGLSKCYELEAVADEAVDAILDRYREELKAIGADDAVLDTLWEQYCQEKVTEKAYYLDKYL